MKKLLILGGSDLQVKLIKQAVDLGYHIITCDYLPNNPGHKYSHQYYNVSTVDKNGVLDLAKKLNVDGVLAYASDPAAPIAAWVCEKLGLPANPYRSVEILSRKDLFRQFLEENGFLTPKARSFTDYDEAFYYFKELNTNAIIKPVDSSGSKGIFILKKGNEFRELFNLAISFSKLGFVIIEEFVEKKGFQIGGDGFLVDGKLVFRCFGDIHFSKTNALLPCSVSVPTLHNSVIVEKVHKTIQDILTKLGMKMGGLNFDVIIDINDNVYIIEIGPRNGGNLLPELIEYCTGVDMKYYAIKSALAEDCCDLKMTYENKYFSHYVIHSHKDGKLKNIIKTDYLNQHLLYEHYNVEIGQQVNSFQNSSNRLGMMLLKYNEKQEMLDLIYNMEEYLKIEVE